MPVHLPHATGMNCDERGGYCFCCFEVAAVGSLHPATFGLPDRGDLIQLKGGREWQRLSVPLRLLCLRRKRSRHLTLEDVKIVQGDFAERVRWDAKIECQD